MKITNRISILILLLLSLALLSSCLQRAPGSEGLTTESSGETTTPEVLEYSVESWYNVLCIFILPPSMKELKEREHQPIEIKYDETTNRDTTNSQSFPFVNNQESGEMNATTQSQNVQLRQ